MNGPDVLRAAIELYRNRQLPGVVAVCRDSLASEPNQPDLRILLARALIGLRRDDEARSELRRSLASEARSATAYRLLGELELRRDDFRSAEIFFRESLRLDPTDTDTADYLQVSLSLIQPTAAVEKLPAAAAAVGCPSSSSGSKRRLAAGTMNEEAAHGIGARPAEAPLTLPADDLLEALVEDLDASGDAAIEDEFEDPCEEVWRDQTPVTAGHALFGTYLVAVGVLTPTELDACLTYHRVTKLRLGVAAVALGLISEPRLEWAAHAYHSQRRSGSRR